MVFALRRLLASRTSLAGRRLFQQPSNPHQISSGFFDDLGSFLKNHKETVAIFVVSGTVLFGLVWQTNSVHRDVEEMKKDMDKSVSEIKADIRMLVVALLNKRMPVEIPLSSSAAQPVADRKPL